MRRIRRPTGKSNVRSNSSANKALLQKYAGDETVPHDLAHLVLAIRVLRGNRAP